MRESIDSKDWEVAEVIPNLKDFIIVFKNKKSKEIRNHHISKAQLNELIIDAVNFKIDYGKNFQKSVFP